MTTLRLTKWELQPDGILRLVLPHCHLRKVSVNAVRKCFEGAHILFMGDSLSRYFYLSLAHFIGKGHWGPKYAKVTHPSYPHSIVSEKDFKNWGSFYAVTNAMLNDPTQSYYEICDCFRDDAVEWIDRSVCVNGFCSQQESCMENRYFRQYSKQGLVRLSYFQFYGPMPMRGRKILSNHTPMPEKEYRTFAESMGRKMCPMNNSIVDDSLNQLPHWKSTTRSQCLVPITPECGWKLRDERDTIDYARWNFPQFYDDDTEGNLEREVMQPMNVSHLILNIGFHSDIHSSETHSARDWVKTRVRSASQYFQKTKNPLLHLPQVTWRGSTAFGPFAQYNDELVRQTQRELGIKDDQPRVHDPTQASLGFLDVYRLSEELWKIHRWIVRYNGSFNIAEYYRFQNGTTQRHFERKKWKEFQELPLVLSEHFGEKNSTSEAIPKYLRSLKLAPIYVDAAHPQPWVYAELHNFFFHVACDIEHA